MGMPAAAGEWTAELVRALPSDGNRYEVVDGALLVTSPPGARHQEVAAELFDLLRQYLKREQVGRVPYSPADIEFDARTLLQPDIFVYSVPGGAKPRRWSEIKELLLAIEIVSPSSARYDRQVKRPRYQRQGVPEYWIVDGDSRLIERWRPTDERPEVLVDVIHWHPQGAGQAIDIPRLFAAALD